MSLTRRKFLTLTAFNCACCLGAASAFAGSPEHASGHASHWSYEGEGAPAHWGTLQPDFKVCELGMQQAPIDLTGAIRAGSPGRLEIAYKALPLRILNNGHTIQVNAEPGSVIVIDGTPYELVQFHFHHPSEHLLSGKAFDMEAHFVHRSAAGGLAVLGSFIKPGKASAVLQPVWDAMPKVETPEKKYGGAIDAAALLPGDRGYFRYTGSLTTPRCSEGLTWTVFRNAIEASPEQIRQFASLFPNNARPVQNRNGRDLFETN
jgi:carbonic anhydrase